MLMNYPRLIYRTHLKVNTIKKDMKDSIRERLITKCQQLTEGWNVRALNVVAWLTKDVETRLLPLINRTADVRRTPQCGPQTSIMIEELLRKLRPYYEHILQSVTDDVSMDTEAILHTQSEQKLFRFPAMSYCMERRIQAAFDKMADAVSNVRARNLIRSHWKQYRDTEPYMNDATAIWKWYGAGTGTVDHILTFLENFRASYLDITDSIKAKPSEETSDDASLPLPDMDYPFLTVAEQEFVASFWKEEKRYPVLYIALRYLQRAPDRPTQTFARAYGMMGRYESIQELAVEYGLTFERTRQMSKLRIDESLPVWDIGRWSALDLFRQPLLTEAIIHWETLQKLEHIEEMNFYSALTIIAALRHMEVIALRADGYKANARRGKKVAWEHPHVLFAYDESMSVIRVRDLMREVGQKAMLQRIEDKTISLHAIAEPYFCPDADEGRREKVFVMLREVLPMFPSVEVREDLVVFRQNHINYPEEIYQILNRRGEAMTVEEIYAEFRKLYPEDHHTDSSFLRSYMLQDERFEAIGRKSTYQLREWQHFAGSLQELAIYLTKDEAEPLPATELIGRMTAQRTNTTAKSCESTIYQTVAVNALQYYITAENNAYAAYVGLPDKIYPPRFWVSPMTVDDAVASMHRFITERGHWPYASSSDGIEARLSYTLRKYSQREHAIDGEAARFRQGMADIPPYQYPHNEREAIFMERCHALDAFWQRQHRPPTNTEEPQLAKWYRETQAKQNQLDDFRRYHFKRIGQKPPAKPHQQLSFDFGEEETH